MSELKTRMRTCDNCESDLTQDAGCHLVLSEEASPTSRPIITVGWHRAMADKHFCDIECLASWAKHSFDEIDVDSNMFSIGGDMIAETGTMGSIGNYAEQRQFAIKLFKAMWKARPTTLGRKSSEDE